MFFKFIKERDPNTAKSGGNYWAASETPFKFDDGPFSKLWVSDSKGPDEIAQKHRLSWAFADHIGDKHQPIWFHHDKKNCMDIV